MKDMTQKDKDLLLKDLSARLPYGVILNCCDSIGEKLTAINENGLINYDYDIEEVKPYLFPLSSMTEEQYNEFFSYYHNIEMAVVKASGDYLKAVYLGENAKHDWLNKNHFDYHYLIPMGLANDATGLNIY